MRRGEVFWGAILVVLGGLFALKTAGYLTGDIFSWFWPLFIMAAGIWILLGGGARYRRTTTDEGFSVPLQGARQGSLRIEGGAGQISLGAGAREGDFLTGVTGPGMNHSVHRVGDRVEVKIEAGPSFIPLLGPEGGVWQYRMNSAIPATVAMQAGAARLDVDFMDLPITHFSFHGGASNLHLKLPARVEGASVEIEAGAASIELRVPEGVALRLRARSIGSLTIDETRFPRRDVDLYESAEYGKAQYRADVTIEGGATSLRVVQEAI